MRVERTFRGITPDLVRIYLESVGAETVEDERATGPGWEAEFAAEKIAIGPSIELTEITITFEGEEAVLEDVVETFARKAVRSGG
ncbi:hypothetical protein HTSR_1959 [Halodesulfurarchaeum formicicum]|uniref:Molybdopterin cofactor biosynthesis MoaD-related C-terminal domain-containing protein n=1 Tax=Halodesulfurarchaeum formicicum TaxID=1873524 RepID=A0A1D8S6Z2_9EURY|nr:hypothetical protein [Halodesulfurarchaeum formicicum]AOW81121.1 hypothetical protein HTSR_1959 [Halodesulfurarchaeum formicicum]APE96463.1 hypothetical protein HSR6_2034 [Halodesulfurarchaeum formicicum]